MSTCLKAAGTRTRRRAAVGALLMIMLPVLLGMAVLTIDVGHMYNVRSELQKAADASVLAVAVRLHEGDDNATLQVSATSFANMNHPGHGNVLTGFTLGRWQAKPGVFVPGGTPTTAVRTLVCRNGSNGNPVRLFFAGIFGWYETDISASATAFRPIFSSRFLIDDEMFDTDVPAIEDLADDLGVPSEALLTDADDDGFIDMPPTVLELPTGQVGDEALFEIGREFAYTSASNPSLADFLLFEEGGNQHGIAKEDLDPLEGVEPAEHASRFPSFVDPTTILISPIYKSDVGDTEPGVNALGERRGLVAFRILDVGADPDGGGSKLPNLIIEIVDPSTWLGSMGAVEGLNGSAALWIEGTGPQIVE